MVQCQCNCGHEVREKGLRVQGQSPKALELRKEEMDMLVNASHWLALDPSAVVNDMLVSAPH